MSTHFLPLISKAFTQQLKSLSSSSAPKLVLLNLKKPISPAAPNKLVGVDDKPVALIKLPQKKSIIKGEPKLKIKTLIENATKLKQQIKKKKKAKSSEIVSFVQKSVGAELSEKFGGKFILNQIPTKVLKSLSTVSTTSYLVDATVAAQIAQLVN
jgi:hypothetical protein